MRQSDDLPELRAEVAAICRRLAAAGLVLGTAGNVSARSGDKVAISATGLRLAGATAEDITVVDVDGQVLAGTLDPTSELGLHLDVYRATESGAVVHAHSAGAIAISLIADELPPVHYQQLALGGTVPVVPFATFGSAELAQSVSAALTHRTAAILANHGSVTRGHDLSAAFEAVVLLEWLCDIYLTAAAVREPRTLTEAQLADVLANVVATGYGTTRPAR